MLVERGGCAGGRGGGVVVVVKTIGFIKDIREEDRDNYDTRLWFNS